MVYRDLSKHKVFAVILFHGDSMTFKNKLSGKYKQLRKNYRVYICQFPLSMSRINFALRRKMTTNEVSKETVNWYNHMYTKAINLTHS